MKTVSVNFLQEISTDWADSYKFECTVRLFEKANELFSISRVNKTSTQGGCPSSRREITVCKFEIN